MLYYIYNIYNTYIYVYIYWWFIIYNIYTKGKKLINTTIFLTSFDHGHSQVVCCLCDF